MKRRSIWALLLIASFAIATPAFADHDDDHGHGNGHGKGHGKGNPHQQQEDVRWERRGNYEYHVFDADQAPPGWSHGKKTGWGNCGLPPGQAKKYGCQTYTYQGHPYYYYHDDAGRIVVRRPSIHIEGSIDIP